MHSSPALRTQKHPSPGSVPARKTWYALSLGQSAGPHGLTTSQDLHLLDTGRSSHRLRTRAQWLDNSSKVEVPVTVDTCFKLWEDRGMIPNWMPWIDSVVVQESDPALSRWTLSTHQFGRQWTFSWLARNLTPVRNQKIHWISEPGSSSMPGIEVTTRGQIRFAKRGPFACSVELTISYAVPSALAPFANALGPVVTSILTKDMQRFKEFAIAHVDSGGNPITSTATATQKATGST